MDSFRRSSFFIRLSKSKVCLALFCFLAKAEAGSLDHATISLYAVHMPSGQVLVSENAQKSLVPSSCLKIVTTASALHLLGPDKRFETKLAYDGRIKGGVLDGNLYIIGDGDPCLGSDRVGTSLPWDKQLNAWVEAIAALKIHKIEGKIIGDASCFEKALAVPSWLWEDLGNYYGAGASGLSFHENSYSLTFGPGSSVGDKTAVLKVEPSIARLRLENEVTTGPVGSGDQACIYGSEFSFIQHVRGTVPAGVEQFTIRGAIPDPALVVSDLLESALKAKGITVTGGSKPVLEKTHFHTTFSPTVAEIVHFTNRVSLNLYAEHFLKKIGQIVEGEGASKAGVQAIKKFLEEKQVSLSGLEMVDGSGLSRKNLMTAEQLVSVLLMMKKSPFFQSFYESLPFEAEGIRAKSGSMGGAKAFVGYSGDVAFAIMINQCNDSKAMKAKIKDFFSFVSKKEFFINKEIGLEK